MMSSVSGISLINCSACGRRIMVRPADVARGQIVCSHTGCGAVNILEQAFHYDENVVKGLPGFGQLTSLADPTATYNLHLGVNVIGTGEGSDVRVARTLHEGKCFISRRHSTLTVTFDKWKGRLRYQLQDGAQEPGGTHWQPSLNGTQAGDLALQKTEQIDVNDGETITLGKADAFRLTHYIPAQAMLDTYRVTLDFNPDRTE